MTQQESAPVTFLYTDLVNSTELLRRLGDERAQRVFQAHHKVLREATVANGGQEVDIVRDLARTSAGASFEERGEHELKGIPEPQRLFAVREQD